MDGARTERITDAEALEMLRRMPTAELMGRADAVRRARHGRRAYHVHSHNLNPTNRCVARCGLCSFWRPDDAPDAYLATLDDARGSLERAARLGLTDLHIVGGLVPELDLAYYEQLFAMARDLLPGVLLQGMTAVEIHWIAQNAGIPVRAALERLRACGLGALSGGGAEIFDPAVRGRIAPDKISAQAWLGVHRAAHGLGIPTNATMLFGHIETDEHLVGHLALLRALQDETGGFRAMIPLPFQANGKALGVRYNPSGDRQVRVAALARLYLDNVPHLRMLVNYMDRKLLGVLLHGGVDDIGGTSLGERIAKAAGAPQDQRFLSAAEMEGFLENHGFEPVLTNSAYGGVPEAPPPRAARPGRWRAILRRAEAGERLGAGDAAVLLDEAPFQELGRAAAARRNAAVPGGRATYVVDKNLNTTNACIAGCAFCAFHTRPGDARAYALEPGQVVEEARRAAAAGATQILVQGGLNPDLGLGYYEECLRGIRDNVDIWIHSLSPAEVEFLARREGIGIAECLRRLKAAGLRSLPGGGAEILDDAVRARISPGKIRSQAWLDVMEAAHGLGLKSTATMVYGFGETTAQRIGHLLKIRGLQDRTGGFTAFIPWSFSPGGTGLECPRRQNGADYLRMVAIARLVLDNVPHLQAGWVTEGPDVAQLALQFGADDFGGVLMTEEVVRATGLGYGVDEGLVVHLIREAGWIPVQRTTQYGTVKVFDA